MRLGHYPVVPIRWAGWRYVWPAVFPVTVSRMPYRAPVLFLPFDLDESDLDIAA